MLDASGLLAVVADFVAVIDELYGYYLDSIYGFHLGRRELIGTQEKVRPTLPVGTDLDARWFSYAVREANDPTTDTVRLRLTQGEFKRRNEKGGHNDRRAVQVAIVFLYEQWESKYRSEIASALGLQNRSALQEPLFGDLRLLRNDIIHRRGRVSEETVRKIVKVSNLREGEEIYFTDENLGKLIHRVIEALDRMVADAGLPDPGHRNRWLAPQP